MPMSHNRQLENTGFPSGNGICHQVHLERLVFRGGHCSVPTATLTNGGIGMLAIGAGGLDVAAAMAGGRIISPCRKLSTSA